MSYCLGVDLGTTYSAAAVWRRGQVAPATLGHVNNVVPSVLFLTTEDELLVGDAAERRAMTEPAAVAREFKRRMGDPVPVLLRSSPFPAEELTARLLEWIVSRVVELEGCWPAALAVTHPANWGPHRVRSLRRSIDIAGYRDVLLLSEPEAAAIEYAHKERVPPGDRVVVYDLGGGTFDVAVLEHDDRGGYRVLGKPQGIDHLGGMEFDALLLAHVSRLAGVDLGQLDPDDPRLLRQLAAMKAACVEAKIDLSTNTATTIVVAMGPLDTEVRVTRAEFERLIQDRVSSTLDSVERALASAQVASEDLRAVLLVGGSSRVPHVARAVSAALRTQVAIDTHSKHAVAMGAALWAAAQAGLADQHVGRLRDRTSRGAPASRSTLRRGDPAPARSTATASRSTVRRPSTTRASLPPSPAGPVPGAGTDQPPTAPTGLTPAREPIELDAPTRPRDANAPFVPDPTEPPAAPEWTEASRAPAQLPSRARPRTQDVKPPGAPRPRPPAGRERPAAPPALRGATGGTGTVPARGNDHAPPPAATDHPHPTPDASVPRDERSPAPAVEPPSPGLTAGLPVIARPPTPTSSGPAPEDTARALADAPPPDRWRRRGTIAPAGTGLRRDRPANRPRPGPPPPTVRPLADRPARKAVAVPHTVLIGALAVIALLAALLVASVL